MAYKPLSVRSGGGKGDVSVQGLDLALWVHSVAEQPATQKAVAELFEQTEGKDIARKMTAHYQNLLRQILQILREGVDLHGSSVGFKTASGRHTQFNHGWDDLTEEYLKRKNRKYKNVFWRNATGSTGDGGGPSKTLLSSFTESVKVANYRINLQRAAVKRGSSQKTPTGASMVVSAAYKADALPEPLDTMVREPFLSGGDFGSVDVEGFAASKWDLSKILFVEGRRPFISDMAAILGRFMYDELSLTR